MYSTYCLEVEKIDINICILDLSQYLNFMASLVTPAETGTEISISLNAPAGLVTEIYRNNFGKHCQSILIKTKQNKQNPKSYPLPPVTSKIYSKITKQLSWEVWWKEKLFVLIRRQLTSEVENELIRNFEANSYSS